jgi:RNA recognition motif-containing protein
MKMRLYVGNLAWRLVETDLEEAFSAYEVCEASAKVIRDRETGRSKGYGFIEVEKGEDALSEMDGREVLGRNLKVNEALKSKQSREPRS